MAITSARNVADFIISFCHEHGDPVSNLKLQKLLYYAQAWHLAIIDGPLFDERIEAWVHGPAVPPVYGDFKQWSWQPIGLNPTAPEFDECTTNHLNEVMDAYGGFSAFQLEQLTHDEDPWKNARRGLAPDDPSHEIILHEDMKRFYRARMDA